MVIDTSAVVAILRNEPEAESFRRALIADPIRLIAATCAFEARMVIVSRLGLHALAQVDLWIVKAGLEIVAVDSELADMAMQAWLTFGKGRHKASLNFADCFSYALARRSDEPLLFKGDDFAKTDVRRVSAA